MRIENMIRLFKKMHKITIRYKYRICDLAEKRRKKKAMIFKVNIEELCNSDRN